MPEFGVLGRSAAAVGSREIVTGQARYAGDFRLPGTLVGKLLYAGHASARIRRLDTTAARSLPGVVTVLTHADIPGENSYLLMTPDQPLLVPEFVRYQGDAVAAVAAETEAAAVAALRAIEVEYEPLPAIFDVLEAMRPDAPQVWAGQSNILERFVVECGDCDAALAGAEVIVEDTYRTHWAEHAFLETESATAVVDETGTVVVYASCQAPHRDRMQIARALGLAENKVRVIQPYVGGAFGGKDEAHVQIHAALLAFLTGRPVCMSRTREESIATHVKRHPMLIHLKWGATSAGQIVGMWGQLIADTGPYRNSGVEVVSTATMHLNGPYKVEHARFEGLTIRTNNPICGAFRGFGMPQAAFAFESQMDALARRVGKDPFTLRLINGLETGIRVPMGTTLRQGAGMKATLREAARLAGWEGRKPEGDLPHPLRRGWGIASMWQPSGFGRGVPDFASVTMDMAADGSVIVLTGAADMGQGTHTAIAQLAAEALGVELAAVRVIGPDTHVTADAGPSVASRQVFVSGNAAVRAAEPIRQSLLETAAGLGFPRSHLSLRRGRLCVEDEEVNITVAELAAKTLGQGRRLHADGSYAMEYPDEVPGWAQTYPSIVVLAFAAHVAQVLVDTETGEVRLERLTAVHDVGQVINPDGAHGQVTGGAAQGLGYAVMEELLAGEGRTQTDSLHTYLIPTAADVPDMTVAFLENGEPYGPFGANGLGEIPLGAASAAIANAIADAIDAPLREIPATPERVLAALAAGGRQGLPGHGSANLGG